MGNQIQFDVSARLFWRCGACAAARPGSLAEVIERARLTYWGEPESRCDLAPHIAVCACPCHLFLLQLFWLSFYFLVSRCRRHGHGLGGRQPVD